MYKIKQSPAWFKNAVELEKGCEVSAGPELFPIGSNDSKPQREASPPANERVQAAFSVLMHKMRISLNLGIEDLAKKIEVEPEQLLRIEKSIGFKPPPRTLLRLSSFYEIPIGVMSQMVGAVKTINPELEESIVSFAAKSDSLEILTSKEKKVLNEFVKAVKSYK